jgi:hypothetical protein
MLSYLNAVSLMEDYLEVEMDSFWKAIGNYSISLRTAEGGCPLSDSPYKSQ